MTCLEAVRYNCPLGFRAWGGGNLKDLKLNLSAPPMPYSRKPLEEYLRAGARTLAGNSE